MRQKGTPHVYEHDHRLTLACICIVCFTLNIWYARFVSCLGTIRQVSALRPFLSYP